MQILYSPSTGTTYFSGVSSNIPDDAIEISEELCNEVLGNRPPGKVIAHTPDGVPYLVDAPPPTDEKLASDAMAERDNRLALAAIRIAPLQDAVDLDDASADDKALLKKWKQYRVEVNRIDQQPKYPEIITWPKEPSN